MSRIDPKLGMEVSKHAAKIKGAGAFLAVNRSCLAAQVKDEALPSRIEYWERYVEDARKELCKSIRTSVKVITSKGFDAKALFVEHGFPAPDALMKLDTPSLVRTSKKLAAFIRRKPEFGLHALFGWKVDAQKIESGLRSIATVERNMKKVPAAARARRKKWDAAVAKLRVAAKAAGVKIRGL